MRKRASKVLAFPHADTVLVAAAEMKIAAFVSRRGSL